MYFGHLFVGFKRWRWTLWESLNLLLFAVQWFQHYRGLENANKYWTYQMALFSTQTGKKPPKYSQIPCSTFCSNKLPYAAKTYAFEQELRNSLFCRAHVHLNPMRFRKRTTAAAAAKRRSRRRNGAITTTPISTTTTAATATARLSKGQIILWHCRLTRQLHNTHTGKDTHWHTDISKAYTKYENDCAIHEWNKHYMYKYALHVHEIASMSNTNIQIVDDPNQNNILKSGNRTPLS